MEPLSWPSGRLPLQARGRAVRVLRRHGRCRSRKVRIAVVLPRHDAISVVRVGVIARVPVGRRVRGEAGDGVVRHEVQHRILHHDPDLVAVFYGGVIRPRELDRLCVNAGRDQVSGGRERGDAAGARGRRVPHDVDRDDAVADLLLARQAAEPYRDRPPPRGGGEYGTGLAPTPWWWAIAIWF